MTGRLPVPPELEHLIEKRESDEARQATRRVEEDRRAANADLAEGAEVDDEGTPVAAAPDRRSGKDRRAAERRRQARRAGDPEPGDG